VAPERSGAGADRTRPEQWWGLRDESINGGLVVASSLLVRLSDKGGLPAWWRCRVVFGADDCADRNSQLNRHAENGGFATRMGSIQATARTARCWRSLGGCIDLGQPRSGVLLAGSM